MSQASIDLWRREPDPDAPPRCERCEDTLELECDVGGAPVPVLVRIPCPECKEANR